MGYHLALLVALPIYFAYNTPSSGIIITSIVLLFLTGIGITGGYHRLFSHQAYKTHPVVEAIILFFGTMACEGSAIKWSHDHRNHHAYVDTDKDPYSIKKGFMFAHMYWLFYKASPIDKKIVADLFRDKLLAFQHRYYGFLMVFTNAITFLFFGWVFNDYLASFIFTWWARLFLLHHFTWFINSLAHTYGSQDFSKEHTAVDNYLISLVTFGEGYHNYHHTYANDYRNGIKWYHYDPTKWLIWTLEKLGLAHNIKKISPFRVKERIVLERQRELKKRLKNTFSIDRERIEKEIEEASERVLNKLNSLKETVKSLKPEVNDTPLELSTKVKEMKKSFKEEWRKWEDFTNTIYKKCQTST